MDISFLRSCGHQLKNIFGSVSKIEKNHHFTKTNPEVLKIVRGSGLLCIAVLLAWISQNETQRSTRLKILETEWPSPRVWRGTLKLAGFEKLIQSDLSAILKNHPDPFNPVPTIWKTEDECLVFITRSPDQVEQTEPEIWSCATSQKKPPRKLRWIKVGSGYSGIDQLAQIQGKAIKKPRSYIDPKEIRY